MHSLPCSLCTLMFLAIHLLYKGISWKDIKFPFAWEKQHLIMPWDIFPTGLLNHPFFARKPHDWWSSLWVFLESWCLQRRLFPWFWRTIYREWPPFSHQGSHLKYSWPKPNKCTSLDTWERKSPWKLQSDICGPLYPFSARAPAWFPGRIWQNRRNELSWESIHFLDLKGYLNFNFSWE